MTAQVSIKRGSVFRPSLLITTGDVSGASCSMDLKRAVNGTPPGDNAPIVATLVVALVTDFLDGQAAWVGTLLDTSILDPGLYVLDARIIVGGLPTMTETVRVTVLERVTENG